MDRVPDYRPPGWRAQIEQALANGAAGIDDAMQWAYDAGIDAQADYESLLRKSAKRSRNNPATGNHTLRYTWRLCGEGGARS